MSAATPAPPIPEHPLRGRHYRYYDLVMAAFVAVLLCSNLIGPAKTCEIHLPFKIWFPLGGGRYGDPWIDTLVFGAGNLFFPISYIFGDVLTEVYGFARTRKVIWAGFGAMIFATLMTQIILRMPLAQSESFNQVLQPALETVFGGTWRIVVGSIIAFWAGDFVNERNCFCSGSISEDMRWRRVERKLISGGAFRDRFSEPASGRTAVLRAPADGLGAIRDLRGGSSPRVQCRDLAGAEPIAKLQRGRR